MDAEADSLFIEVHQAQLPCRGERLPGDLFHSRRLEDGRRVVSVLADGLSTGIEAAVLASATASMALEYVAWNIDTERAATILMDSLPSDPERQISYSAFTIIDAQVDGRTRIFEHGNPGFMLIRQGALVPIEKRCLGQQRWGNRRLEVSELQGQVGDRIVVFSDGVSQSGMGTEAYPLGWGEEAVAECLLEHLNRKPDLSSRGLARLLVHLAKGNDGGSPGDDITCGIIHFRHPRIMQVLTGPPFDRRRDREFAALMNTPGARKVICGGTTGNIIARELHREIEVDLGHYHPEVPNPSSMAGAEIVTEGCLTLGKVAEYLESGPPARPNAASRMVDLLLESDVIHFQVGTRVNEAHQDPSLPVELDIRRNVIKRIAALLEQRHLKRTGISYY
ncbi:MAG: Stage sporulation family protein [Holophagaceae bacterium]|nr:Stage sporulation family protein [Holophagaceae bacterium]